MPDTGQPTIERNEERGRYEIHVGDEVAGFLEFRSEDGRILLPSTYVDPAHQGDGLGSTLAAGALADLAQRGDTVVPICPFVVHYLRENEVAGLVVDWSGSGEAADSAAPSEPA